jgi:protein TonB
MKKVILLGLMLVSFVGCSQITEKESDDVELHSDIYTEIHSEIIESVSNQIYIVADEMPKYSESIRKFREFVSENFKNPTTDRDFKGQIILQFVVEKDGSLSDIKVVRDLGYGTGAEVIRVLKLAGKWKAGLIDEKPVRVRHILPIRVDVKANQE